MATLSHRAVAATRPLQLALVAPSEGGCPTGGSLYLRQLARAAPHHAATLQAFAVPAGPFPLPVAAGAGMLGRALASGGRAAAVLVDCRAAAYLAPAARGCRCWAPLVGLVHRPPGGLEGGPLRRRLQGALELLFYRRATLLVTTSYVLADDLVARGLPRERLVVVPPGRDGAEAVLGVERPHGLRQGSVAAFLCVANWQPYKGLHLLLEAFALLPRQAGVLHLVGDASADPAYARRLRQRLARPDLQGRVVVHGCQGAAALAGFYRAADVFVLPATAEPCGTAYAEALAAGLPVVGWRAGLLQQLVTPGVEALLAPPDDAPALAMAMLRLAEDERLRRAMGEAAHARAQSLPTWAETAENFFAAVRGVVEKQPPP
ncbi:MAG: glycosyltransferase family 4 protein [Chloroflexota bacterium]